MSLVPDDKVGKILFYQIRVGRWAERAAEIGTTPEQCAELADLTAEAKQAYADQWTAQQAAMNATRRLRGALDRMTTAGAKIIMQVRARAAVAGDGVYQAAFINAPATPAPVGEPGTPTRFAAELQNDGALLLKWKCTNPAGAVGTTYHIERAIGPAEPMVYVGTVGEKKFLDETYPAGTATIMYRVRAVRSTKVGKAATHVVMLGGGGPMVGGMVVKTRTVRIAA